MLHDGEMGFALVLVQVADIVPSGLVNFYPQFRARLNLRETDIQDGIPKDMKASLPLGQIVWRLEEYAYQAFSP